MRFWHVEFSYLAPPISDGRKRWRDNGRLGVAARTIEGAIAAARLKGMPEGSSDMVVWSVSHHGRIDIQA